MSEEKLFKVGDIVKLKSGGPDMTVKEIIIDIDGHPTGHYRGQWFAGKKLDNGVFPYQSLKKVEDES